MNAVSSYPPVLASVDAIQTEAARWAQAGRFDAESVEEIALACREAAANAVLHGACQDPAMYVRVAFTLSAESLEVRIADSGVGFDPTTLADPLLAENLIRSSGRGLLLMRSLMDEVRVRLLNPGTEVTLIKMARMNGPNL